MDLLGQINISLNATVRQVNISLKGPFETDKYQTECIC